MNSELVATVFKLINFGIFAGLVIHLSRKYLVPMVQERIHQEKLKQKFQQDHIHGLEQEIVTIQTRTQEQQKYAKQLFEKIQRWSRAVNHWQDKREQEQQRCRSLTAARVKQAQKGMQQNYITKKIMSNIITQLENDTKNYYQDPIHAQAAITSIITSLEKKCL